MNDAWINESSSLIWVCSSNEKRSYATILDANNPNNILESFIVCSSHLLCVASVSGYLLLLFLKFFLFNFIKKKNLFLGVHKSEIRLDEEFRSKLICDGGYLENIPNCIDNVETFGSVNYVELMEIECDDKIPTYSSIDEKQSIKRSRDCKKTIKKFIIIYLI